MRGYRWKLKRICVVVLVATTCIIYLQWQSVHRVSITRFNAELRDPVRYRRSAPKVVLYWTKAWAPVGFLLGLGSAPFSGCRFSNCVATDDSSQLSQAAAVLFHGVAMRSDQLPPPRPPGQLWVFVQRECPLMVDVPFGRFDGLFNATMTYRSDSDIVYRYFEVTQRSQSEYVSSPGEVVERNLTQLRMAAWVVSHCKTASRRDRYVKRLQQHLEVDIYGRCSADPNRKQCSGERSRHDRESCYKHLAQRYLFYLAFENSFCKDYITEKVFLPLRFGMVPVVRGLSRQEYELLTPPDSFIHVDDFNSTAELAEYLHHLRHHPHEYSRYHTWRDTHRVQEPRKPALCRLCQLVHQQNPPLEQNGRVQNWWKDSSICWRPE